MTGSGSTLTIVSDSALVLSPGTSPSTYSSCQTLHFRTMYIRSSSEPPDQNEDQLKNGLRGGFPVKINGYALGSQENLQDLGRETSAERSCIFGPRVRSRQNSVSRQSSVSRNLDPEPEGGGGGALYTSTPFGPLQGTGEQFSFSY